MPCSCCTTLGNIQGRQNSSQCEESFVHYWTLIAVEGCNQQAVCSVSAVDSALYWRLCKIRKHNLIMVTENRTQENFLGKQQPGTFPLSRNLSRKQETEIKSLIHPNSEVVPLALIEDLFTNILHTYLTNMTSLISNLIEFREQ